MEPNRLITSLPNEILIEIAEHAIQFQSPDTKPILFKLLSTSNLFAHVSRSHLYAKVALSADVGILPTDAQFLSRDSIAKHIKRIDLQMDESVPRMANSDSAIELAQWGWNIRAGFRSVLSACASHHNLHCLTVKITGKFGYLANEKSLLFHNIIVRLLSELNIPSLRGLVLETPCVDFASPFWNHEGLTICQRNILRKNLDRVLRFEIHFLGRQLEDGGLPELGICDQLSTLRGFERWLGSLRELREISLDHFFDMDDFKSGKQLTAAALMGFSKLQKLELRIAQISDSLSRLLHDLASHGKLEYIALECCAIDPDVDRWRDVFVACLHLPLKSITVDALFYLDDDNDSPCTDTMLCSPFGEDKAALVDLINYVNKILRVSGEDRKEIRPKICGKEQDHQ